MPVKASPERPRQDSDDYFDDDFTLTEKDLEAIDEAQNRYLARTHSNNPSQPSGARHTPPPAKRQKTNHVWNQTPNQPSSSREDLGEMPEIMVQGDGSYAVYGEAGGRGVNSGSGVVHRPRVVPRPLSKTPSAQSQSVSAVQASKHRPQPISRASSTGSAVSVQRGLSPAVDQPRRSATPVTLRRASGAQMAHRTGSGTDKEGNVLQELQNLRTQLTEVRVFHGFTGRLLKAKFVAEEREGNRTKREGGCPESRERGSRRTIREIWRSQHSSLQHREGEDLIHVQIASLWPDILPGEATAYIRNHQAQSGDRNGRGRASPTQTIHERRVGTNAHTEHV